MPSESCFCDLLMSTSYSCASWLSRPFRCSSTRLRCSAESASTLSRSNSASCSRKEWIRSTRCCASRLSPATPFILAGGLSPDIADGEPVRKRIPGIDHVLREAGDPGLPGERRQNGGVRSHVGLLDQPAGE